jgi:iron complex outermembrane receptor protein
VKKLKLLFKGFALSMCIATLAMAQKNISGKITDDQNGPLIGATVTIKGSGKGAVTNINGDYSIQGLANGNYNVVASFVGFGSMTRAISVVRVFL